VAAIFEIIPPGSVPGGCPIESSSGIAIGHGLAYGLAHGSYCLPKRSEIASRVSSIDPWQRINPG
jgi:hypothetical protein